MGSKLKRNVAHVVEHWIWCAADAANTGLTPWSSKGFFSRSKYSVQILMVFTVPHVQSHALTPACILKILAAGSHTIVWMQERTERAKYSEISPYNILLGTH